MFTSKWLPKGVFRTGNSCPTLWIVQSATVRPASCSAGSEILYLLSRIECQNRMSFASIKTDDESFQLEISHTNERIEGEKVDDQIHGNALMLLYCCTEQGTYSPNRIARPMQRGQRTCSSSRRCPATRSKSARRSRPGCERRSRRTESHASRGLPLALGGRMSPGPSPCGRRPGVKSFRSFV